MGNVTITPKRRTISGNRVRRSFDITFSNSYATNGDVLPTAELAKILPGVKVLTDLNLVDIFHSERGPAGHSVYLDRTNLKVKAFNGTTEIANAVDLSAVVVRCMIEFGDEPSSTV